MARPLRIEFAGAVYHAMSRGNARGEIVHDDADRLRRLDWLKRTAKRYRWRVFAFVLMDNHDHLFLQTPEANLSAGMQHLNGSYTGYFNRRHRRAGHLFQGRFKGHLIEEEGYFLEVSRYIHLNPVRARITRRPEAYRWSSCAGYVRASRELDWIDYRAVLGEFAGDPVSARRAYGRFLRQGVEERPRSPFADAVGGLLLGSAAFLARVGREVADRPADADVPQLSDVRPRPSLERIVQVVAGHFGRGNDRWQPGRRSDGVGRAVAAYLARRRFAYPANEVAAALGYRGHGSVRNAVGRVESGYETLGEIVAELHEILTND